MKKIGYFLFSFLPIITILSLQIILMIPLAAIVYMSKATTNLCADTPRPFSAILKEVSQIIASQNFSYGFSVLFAICGIIIFTIWYVGQFRRNDLTHTHVSFQRTAFSLLLIVPGLQLCSGILTSTVSLFFPSWLEQYQKLLEAAGMTEQHLSILLILYSILLGPIEEELVFRGVTLSSAKKALPFWLANCLQAALFGIFHLNYIQGIYAFFIGLVLGYVTYRSGSLLYSILLHMLFNAYGTLISRLLPSEQSVFYLFFIPVSFALLIVGIQIFLKATKANTANAHAKDLYE